MSRHLLDLLSAILFLAGLALLAFASRA